MTSELGPPEVVSRTGIGAGVLLSWEGSIGGDVIDWRIWAGSDWEGVVGTGLEGESDGARGEEVIG